MMKNLLPYPSEWKGLLNLFDGCGCFSKPQFGNFCQAATGMAVSQYSAISRWSRLFCKKDQSTLNDFFNESPWDDASVYDRLSRLIARRVKDAYLGIIDDTLSHKPYAKKMENVGWFYDGKAKEQQKGHNVVTSGVKSLELNFVPSCSELYKKGSGRSKNDIACTMVRRICHYNKNVIIFAVDSWYSNSIVLGGIKRCRKHYVTEIKSNRNVTIGNKKRFAREHEKHIPKKRFTEAIIKGAKYRYFQTSAFIKSLGSVNLVFSQKYDENEKKWGETYYLITDILTMQGDKVIELYLERGLIEGFHREGKQQLGMEEYQLCNSRGIERYLFLVLLVFVLLLLLSQQAMRKTSKSQTIGELREQLKAECYTILLQKSKHMTEEQQKDLVQRFAKGL